MLQTGSIEFALVEKQVFEGLKTGSAVLKELNNEMKVEDVERLMDDTADAVAYQQEVSDLLSSKITEEDEEEIERELELLAEAERTETSDSVLGKLPMVPTAEPPKVEDKGWRFVCYSGTFLNHIPVPATAEQEARKTEDLLAS